MKGFKITCVWFICLMLAFSDDINSKKSTIENLRIQLQAIDSQLQKNDSIWLKRYTNYANYNTISHEIEKIRSDLQNIQSSNEAKSKNQHIITEKTHALETLERQLDLLVDYKDNPFRDLIQAPQIPESPVISNPFAIFNGISYIKTIKNEQTILDSHKSSLERVIALVNEKYNILVGISAYDKSNQIAQITYATQLQLLEFESAHNVLVTTIDIYNKKYEEAYKQIYSGIKNQILKLIYIGLAILISIGLAFSLKIIGHRYIKDSRIYTFNKIINFFNLSIIVLILLFGYLENVTYLIAVLGFASAGLAIAMKDLFMSLLGWVVIVIGGSVHVGDRIRIQKDGLTYIGDVLDISMLRITIYEDVTLTTYLENRRAGRIIFVPNNYIFTTMIANYTHGGMLTVWDGIDFSITFDSNLEKALKIATEVAIKYSKGYTQIIKKKLRKMRDKYSLRNSNTEPRAYSFIEPNGIKISIWYQTNAYSTLSLRSSISLEIMQRILKEPDIFIAYETTKFVQTPYDGFGDKSRLDSRISEPSDNEA